MRHVAFLVPIFVFALGACHAADAQQAAVEVAPPMALEVGAYDAALLVDLPERTPEESDGLHKVYRLSDRIISGAEPLTKDALRKVSEMGVKTILCVDGKAPDAETAAEYGMRYVHLPIQYKGISEEELTRMTKMFRELEGPFYVHCFHGAHRGPTAAAVGRIVVDGAPREQALAEMRQWAGASGKYAGLYESIATAEFPTPEQTSAVDWDFPATHQFEGVRGAMVPISRAWDLLLVLDERGWEIDPEHPDVDPRNETEKLAQALALCADVEGADEEPDDFRGWLGESIKESAALRDAVARAHAGDESAKTAASASLKRVEKLCKSCHTPYRNN